MATATAPRGLFMPTTLGPDDQVVWWILGTIARQNADGRWTPITVAELDAFDEDQWTGLVDDTPEVDGPLTTAQRALLRYRLEEAETEDLDFGQRDRWWER